MDAQHGKCEPRKLVRKGEVEARGVPIGKPMWMGSLSNRKHVVSRLVSPCGWGDISTQYFLYRLRMTGIDSPGQKTKGVNVRAMSTRVCACNEHQDMCVATSVAGTISIQFQIDLRISSGPMIHLHVFV